MQLISACEQHISDVSYRTNDLNNSFLLKRLLGFQVKLHKSGTERWQPFPQSIPQRTPNIKAIKDENENDDDDDNINGNANAND